MGVEGKALEFPVLLPMREGCLCVGWSKVAHSLPLDYLEMAIIRGTLLLQQGGRRGEASDAAK